MPKKEPLTYLGQDYDSAEEIEFQIFLNACKKWGLVRKELYQPQSFVLTPRAVRHVTKRFKTKPDRVEERTLFQEHKYTPDWEVEFTPLFFDNFPKHKLLLQDADSKVTQPVEPDFRGNGVCLIDVKGSWNLHGGDRIFPIHQKLMWYEHRKLVNKVVPKQLFARLGVVPDELKWMKNRKNKTPKKAYQFVDTFEDKIQRGLLTIAV